MRGGHTRKHALWHHVPGTERPLGGAWTGWHGGSSGKHRRRLRCPRGCDARCRVQLMAPGARRRRMAPSSSSPTRSHPSSAWVILD